MAALKVENYRVPGTVIVWIVHILIGLIRFLEYDVMSLRFYASPVLQYSSDVVMAAEEWIPGGLRHSISDTYFGGRKSWR